jgi:hypothetical protein
MIQFIAAGTCTPMRTKAKSSQVTIGLVKKVAGELLRMPTRRRRPVGPRLVNSSHIGLASTIKGAASIITARCCAICGQNIRCAHAVKGPR